MKNDLLKVFFIIWGIILFVELVWFSSGPRSTSETIFAITVIAVTSVFGSVGMYLFKS